MGSHRNRNLQVPFAIFIVYCCCSFPQLCEAATTDPKEVEALRAIGSKINLITMEWNFNLDPCIKDSSWYTMSDTDGELGVICSCVFNNNTTCHVTELRMLYNELNGILPPELANLTYLETIDLRYNLLSGSIPELLGSLPHLKELSLGKNRLIGKIPNELGNLTNLKFLDVDSNHLSGTLPPQLGNLTKLEQFYLQSNQISGTIPTTFSNLKKLRIFSASSNNFTGKLPNLVGNWTQLEDLKLEGTSFEGPIPSTISNLTKLTRLIICDLPNGGTSLSFLPNLKNLAALILRNNNISGQIPEYIGEFDKLQMLRCLCPFCYTRQRQRIDNITLAFKNFWWHPICHTMGLTSPCALPVNVRLNNGYYLMQVHSSIIRNIFTRLKVHSSYITYY